MLRNVAALQKFVVDAAEAGARLVVTPEQGISGFPFTTRAGIAPYLQQLPGPNDDPCAGGSAVVCAVSKMARTARVVVVVGLPSMQPCTNATAGCPSDGHFNYNSQVVVDVDGRFVSVYHKTHLFEAEDAFFNPAPASQPLKTFFVDGVVFGQAICFDIFFRTPMAKLALGAGVRNFAFSTWWVNTGTTPLMSAVDLQQSASKAYNATLVAANTGAAGYISSGSGIYVGGVPATWSYNPTAAAKSVLLVAKVPVHLQSPAPARPSAAGVVDRRPVPPAPVAAVKPQLTAMEVGAGESASMAAVSGDVVCNVSVTVAAGGDGRRHTFAAYANGGSFCTGLLPSQTCGLLYCPAGNCSALPLPLGSGPALDSFHVEATVPRIPTRGCAFNTFSRNMSDPFVVFTPVTLASGAPGSPNDTSLFAINGAKGCNLHLHSTSSPLTVSDAIILVPGE